MVEPATPFEFSTVEDFFPTPVWVFDLAAPRAAALNATLCDCLESLLAPLPDIKAGAIWQTEQNLHEVAQFGELVSYIQQGADTALRALHVTHSPVMITGCWANISPRGGGHTPHVHPNNYLSGVYYVKVPPGAASISFHDPRAQANTVVPRPIAHNVYNSITHTLPLEEGRLVIFPAWLAHSVAPNRDDAVRISISFNLMFTDFSASMSAPLWRGLKLKQPT